MDSLTLKCNNSFQNQNNGKATYNFAPRTLIFILQQEVLKFSDICVSWSSLKTDLPTIFLTLSNLSFENVSIVTLGKYLTFLYLITNLFISFLDQFVSLIELKNIH